MPSTHTAPSVEGPGDGAPREARPPPRILFGGDPHGNFRPMLDAALAHRPDAVILLGDCDLEWPLDAVTEPLTSAGIPLWWIPGNHDGDRVHWFDNLFHSALGHRNLHGRVVRIAGLRVAGLGGVFRGAVWNPRQRGGRFHAPTRAEYLSAHPDELWRGGLPCRHRVSIWREDYDRLRALRADVLVCHEPPSSHRHGFHELDDLALAMGARLIVHGHTHRDYGTVLRSGIRVIGVDQAAVRLLPADAILSAPKL